MTTAASKKTASTKQESQKTDKVGYIGGRLSKKQYKFMLKGLTGEAKKSFQSAFCPNLKTRVDRMGTMDLYNPVKETKKKDK